MSLYLDFIWCDDGGMRAMTRCLMSKLMMSCYDLFCEVHVFITSYCCWLLHNHTMKTLSFSMYLRVLYALLSYQCISNSILVAVYIFACSYNLVCICGLFVWVFTIVFFLVMPKRAIHKHPVSLDNHSHGVKASYC